MLYREAGQYKTSYQADEAVFPILQDRIAIGLLLAVAFLAVPLLASEYLLRAVMIPFLILSLAALGLNIPVGYCGQISLGTGVSRILGSGGRVAGVETSRGAVGAGAVVVATGSWGPLLTREFGLDLPIRPMRLQAVATKPMPKLFELVENF